MSHNDGDAPTKEQRFQRTVQCSEPSMVETRELFNGQSGSPASALGGRAGRSGAAIPRTFSEEPLTQFSTSSFRDRYRAGEPIAQGGMSEVRTLRDSVIGRDVAGKFLSGRYIDRPRERARFIREACVQGRLQHPSIVPVHDIGISPDGLPFFTMMQVHGLTLREIIDGLRAGTPELASRFSRRKLLAAFGKVCLTMAFAHDRGVIHRDVKPSNIMLGDFGETYVLDWGIAKFVGSGPLDSVEDIAHRLMDEQDRQVFGTAGYMAPEQVCGPSSSVTPLTDVYSLGAVLFEILTLQPLNPGSTPGERMQRTLEGVDANNVALFSRCKVPPELEAICLRAIALSRYDRYPSARALHDDLERYLDGERDEAVRRDLTARYMQQAEDAERRAASADSASDEESHRSQAIQNLGRAIAVDTDQGEAMSRLVNLLLTQPRFNPPEVQEEVTRTLRKNERELSRTIGRVCLAALPAIPLGLTMGVRDWVTFTIMCLALVTIPLNYFFWIRHSAGMVGPRLFSLLIGAVGIVATARQFGPLFLTPLFFLSAVVAASISPLRPVRVAGVAITVGGQITAACLEWSHLIPPSYRFEGGALTVLPRMLNFPPQFTFAYLFAINVVAILMMGLGVLRVRNSMELAEKRIQTHAWQLRQMIPRTG